MTIKMIQFQASKRGLIYYYIHVNTASVIVQVKSTT
jgi:hypothetical protein